MANSKELELNRVFHALADPTRRAILKHVSKRDATVGELAKPFDISAPAVSKHLRVLEEARLLKRIRDGKTHRFHLQTDPLRQAEKVIDQLASYWSKRLDSLEEYFNNLNTGKSKNT